MNFNLKFFFSAPPPPSVMWAQRSGIILVTINLEDCKNPEVKYVLFFLFNFFLVEFCDVLKIVLCF